MALGPSPDLRQTRAERARDDVRGLTDEDRAVADPREALDLLDHLRVVVRGQLRLTGTAFWKWQEANEIGQPGVGRGLALGVLVQEVIDVPRLVADPQIERVFGDDVVEHHEVRAQDLVHPAQRPEGVQLVLAGLPVEMPRLAGQRGARGMDRLAAALEHRRHRGLGEPLDIQVGDASAQRVGDRDVAPRVAETDRRRDEQRPPRTRAGANPAGGTRRRSVHLVGERTDQAVDANRVTRLRPMPGAFEGDQPAAGQLGDPRAALPGGDPVAVAVDHEHRARGRLGRSPRPPRDRRTVARIRSAAASAPWCPDPRPRNRRSAWTSGVR